jgi:two-component system CheB/CheR fusion protein
MHNVIEDFELVIQQKKADIIYDCQLPVIKANPVQMNQLFYNIIDNALKFSRTDSKPVIKISCDLETSKPELNGEAVSDMYHHLQIWDNGIGFDMKYSEQLFDIFKKLHSHDQYSGSGIGLAASKKIVLNHRGRIFAESNKDSGTTIHILLPADKIQ